MSIEAMKQALEALECALSDDKPYIDKSKNAITSLRQAIQEEALRNVARLGQEIEAEAEQQVSYSGNGTAGRENMTAPTGFFFEMPKTEQEPVGEIYGWHGKSQSLCRWFVPEKNLPVGTKLYVACPEPELNPVAWHEPSAYGNVTTHKDWALANGWQPLYTHPQPKREWVGLTDEEMKQVCYETFSYDPYVVAKAIEAKLKEKNNATSPRTTGAT